MNYSFSYISLINFSLDLKYNSNNFKFLNKTLLSLSSKIIKKKSTLSYKLSSIYLLSSGFFQFSKIVHMQIIASFLCFGNPVSKIDFNISNNGIDISLNWISLLISLYSIIKFDKNHKVNKGT